MAINIHVARTAFMRTDALGNVVSKENPNNPLSMQLSGSHEHRVLYDEAIPSTADNPTVKQYLELEAQDDYKLQYMDQNTIVTYQ